MGENELLPLTEPLDIDSELTVRADGTWSSTSPLSRDDVVLAIARVQDRLAERMILLERATITVMGPRP